MKNEGEAEAAKNGTYSSSSHIMKPLINGCLTGQVRAVVRYCRCSIQYRLPCSLYASPDFNYKMRHLLLMQLKQDSIFGLTYSTASLGLYEILTKKLITSRNDGEPLSLYQEACCGVTSGVTTALVFQPFRLVFSQIAAQNTSHMNVFNTITQIARKGGVYALWKSPNLLISTEAASIAGMLISYNRSLNYLVESKGFSKWHAVLSASIISGFSAAACGMPCLYVISVKQVLQEAYNGGDKHAYRQFPYFISRVFAPNSGYNFYTEFLNYFRFSALLCLVQWPVLEIIRSLEESIDGN